MSWKDRCSLVPIRRLLSRLPLPVAITIPFALQVAVAVGGVAYLSYRSSQVTAQNLAGQVKDELSARILDQLSDTLDDPVMINQINATSLVQGDINLISGSGSHLLWQQANLFSAINHIYCATEADGAFLGVGRSLGGTGDRFQIQMTNPDLNRLFHYHEIDIKGHLGSLDWVGDRVYDPRLRPWYIEAKAQGQHLWSSIYLDFETQLPTITAALPVYTTDDTTLLGVCATDVILSEELNGFLRDLHISANGLAFIVDHDGTLIASSTPEPITAGTGDNTALIAAQDSSNALIRSTVTYLSEAMGPLPWASIDSVLYRIGRDRYTVETKRYSDDLGLDWTLVIVIPEADFMGPINANNRLIAKLYLLALGLTGLSGLAIARWVTRPLHNLSDRAKAIAQGQWDETIVLDRADAIGDLSRSLAAMAQQLKAVFTTLEQRVEERNQDLLQLNQELQRLVNIDGLTQAANRRYFDHFMNQEWQRLAREQQPLSLLLCDVDHFKAYNDTYGHQAGDRCLQDLAALFMHIVHRPADLVARYGGEEFAIVLPHTDQAGAAHIARQIGDAVAALHLPHSAAPLGRVSVSLGLATAIPIPGYHHQDLVGAADQALYLAKNDGRNTYRLAKPWTTVPMD